MRTRDNRPKYIFLDLLSVCFLASTGIFMRNCTIPPVNVGFWRMLFALPALFLLARKNLRLLTKKDVAILLLAGVCFAGDLILFNMAFGLTSVANTNLLANLTPFTVIPVSYFLFKEKLPKHFLFGVFVTIGGLMLLIKGKANPVESSYLGDMMAFCVSFFYGGYLLISYRSRDRLPSAVILFVSAFSAILTLGIAAALIEGIQVPRTFNDIWPIIAITVLVQLTGQNLLSHCSGMLSVNLTTAISLSQPAISAVYSFLLLGEKLSLMEVCGLAVVVLGVYLVKRQYSGHRQK